MRLAAVLFMVLTLAGCGDPFEYSNKISARDWGDRVDDGFKRGLETCYPDSIRTKYALESAKSILSLGDSVPFGGWVFTLTNRKNGKTARYILWAKDTTSGQNVWRVIFSADNKAEFNQYCAQTPFADFVLN